MLTDFDYAKDNRTQEEFDSDWKFWWEVSSMIIPLLAKVWPTKDLTCWDKKWCPLNRPASENFGDCQITLPDGSVKNIEIKWGRNKYNRAYRKTAQREHWTLNNTWLLYYQPWEFCIIPHNQPPDRLWLWFRSKKPQREYTNVFWMPLDMLYICFK